VDADFFSAQPFDEERLLQRLQKAAGFAVASRREQTLHGAIHGTRVSFLGYEYPVLFPLTAFLGVEVADPRDIACMKINAIAGRGLRRDFVDLYAASRQFGLQELLRLFQEKFARLNYNRVHVLKSLTYFGDAEKDPMPEMLAQISWTEVRSFFEREAPALLPSPG